MQIMDTGEAVIDDEDDESDALFTMDDLTDGAADAKKETTDEVNPSVGCPVGVDASVFLVPVGVKGFMVCCSCF